MKWYQKIERKIKTAKKKIKNSVLKFIFIKKIKKIIASGQKHVDFAFLTPLPPAKTGTGLYAVKVYQHILDKMDFISDIYNTELYQETLSFVPEKYHNHIVPLCLKHIRNYNHVFLNIGNNSFHIPYMKYGIETKGQMHRYIVLCETQICGMLYDYYESNGIDFINILKKYYPERIIRTEELSADFWGTLRKLNIFGIRILIDLTGVNHFVLYRNVGKELLLADIQGTEYEKGIKITVIPMGVEKISPFPALIPLEKQGYNIGSFGIASDMKQTDKVINAVNILEKRGEKITLWLCGYEISKYAEKFDSSNLCIIENVSYDKLLSIMASVDLAVQLRQFSNGESSGCITELIALNKNFIASENLFEPHFREAGVSVFENCTAEELADVILSELKNRTVRNNSKILENYSFKNTAEKLTQLVQ